MVEDVPIHILGIVLLVVATAYQYFWLVQFFDNAHYLSVFVDQHTLIVLYTGISLLAGWELSFLWSGEGVLLRLVIVRAIWDVRNAVSMPVGCLSLSTCTIL